MKITTLAPKGKHVASLFCQHFRYKLPQNASWDGVRDAAADHVVATVEKYAPGFGDSIIARQIHSPLDLERRFGLVGGDIFHGKMGLDQLFSARPMIGVGVRPLLERALAERGKFPGEAEMDALFDRYLRHYQDHIADRSRPYPGLEPALDRIGARGFSLAVCTNKYEALSLRLLDALGLTSRFAAVCGQDTFPMKKPDPDMLRLTIQRAGGDIARAVMVGDSETDAKTAKTARIPFIAVSFGYRNCTIEELGADAVIDHFDELIPALTRISAGQS